MQEDFQKLKANQMNKHIIDKYVVPPNQNLNGWGLPYEGYTLLCAIANYSHGHIQSRANFYLSGDYSIEEKRRMKSGDGGFMSAVLRGDMLDAWWRGSQTQRDAINRALFVGELDMPTPQKYYDIEKSRAKILDEERSEFNNHLNKF